MTPAVTPEALVEALAEFQRRNGYHRPEIEELLMEFGELVLATALAAYQQVTAERDEAREAEHPDDSTIGTALPGRFTLGHYGIYRRIADGTTGAFMAPGDVRMLLDEIARLWTREAAARAGIEGALCGISDDYMTSEKHHPGYVLIPVEKFEQLRVAEAALSSTAPGHPRCR